MQDSIKRRSFRIKLWIGALLAFVFMAVGLYYFPSHQPEEKGTVSTRSSIAAQMLKLPLFFERNEGQTDASVKFLTRGRGYSFYFTPKEIVMIFQANIEENQKFSHSILKMSFVGANPKPMIAGIDEASSTSHYFIGNNPKQWRPNIPHYAKVAYQGLYSGIDAIFYGNGEQFEYDLCIAPGTNPQNARFHIEGANQLYTDSEGNLHIVANEGQEVLMHKPFVYQKINEEMIAISGEFVLLAQNEVGFSIGPYDASKELVIDPVITSSYLGGNSTDNGTGIAVDQYGNAYVSGKSSSTNLPVR